MSRSYKGGGIIEERRSSMDRRLVNISGSRGFKQLSQGGESNEEEIIFLINCLSIAEFNSD